MEYYSALRMSNMDAARDYYTHTHIYVYMCIYMCVCVSVCSLCIHLSVGI